MTFILDRLRHVSVLTLQQSQTSEGGRFKRRAHFYCFTTLKHSEEECFFASSLGALETLVVQLCLEERMEYMSVLQTYEP